MNPLLDPGNPLSPASPLHPANPTNPMWSAGSTSEAPLYQPSGNSAGDAGLIAVLLLPIILTGVAAICLGVKMFLNARRD